MKKVLILLLWLLPSCSVVIFAQTQRIAGTVVVGDGQPAVGAAIVVKGTNIGAVTNVDGKFVIAEAPASAQRLVVYHVGMERKEVDVAPNVYIQLQPVEQGFSWNVKACSVIAARMDWTNGQDSVSVPVWNIISADTGPYSRD